MNLKPSIRDNADNPEDFSKVLITVSSYVSAILREAGLDVDFAVVVCDKGGIPKEGPGAVFVSNQPPEVAYAILEGYPEYARGSGSVKSAVGQNCRVKIKEEGEKS